MAVKRAFVVVLLIVSLANLAPAHPHAAVKPQPPSDIAEQVRRMLSTNGASDLGYLKIAFDKLAEPSVDVSATLAKLDVMVTAIRKMAGPAATKTQLLGALRRYVYETGPWNDNKAFSYDLTDPLGQKPSNRLLSTYLSTRKGNCVSMPFLYLVLGDRLGLEMTASMAPLHVFVKYTEQETGRTYNLETTSGAYPARDDWYRQNLPMSNLAVQNGIYLAALTRQQTVALMATVVVEHLIGQGRYEDATRVADSILESYPKFAYAMVLQGTAYEHLLDIEFRQKYATLRDIPESLRPRYQHLNVLRDLSIDSAEALGWRASDGQKQ